MVAITLAASLALGGAAASGLWWMSHRARTGPAIAGADASGRPDVLLTLPDRFEDVPGVPDELLADKMRKALGPMLAEPIQVLFYDTSAGEVHVVAGKTKSYLGPEDIESVTKGFALGSDKNGRHAERLPAPRGASAMMCVTYTATSSSCLTVSPTSAEMIILIGRSSTQQTATSMWEASATVR